MDAGGVPWLEEADMKHIMNTCIFRQLESISNISDALCYLIRPSIFWAELLSCSRKYGLSGAVEEMKPYPIAHSKLDWPVSGVLVLLGVLLCLKQSSTDIS